MPKKKEDKKLTKDQAEKKIMTLKKDLFNIRFKKINNQVSNPAQYNEIKGKITSSSMRPHGFPPVIQIFSLLILIPISAIILVHM